MAPVIPRWEWRTFGASFGVAEDQLQPVLGPARHSVETYLVSRHSDANTKIRDNLLDIKLLEQRDDQGLELWRPVLKAAFPLTASDLARIADAWRIPHPSAPWAASSVDAFVDGIAAQVPDVQVVRVTKARRGADVEGCLLEIAELTFDGHPIKTVAIESTDREGLWTLVLRYGFDRTENTNYVKALKQHLTGSLR